jgi:hypothetical protein
MYLIGPQIDTFVASGICMVLIAFLAVSIRRRKQAESTRRKLRAPSARRSAPGSQTVYDSRPHTKQSAQAKVSVGPNPPKTSQEVAMNRNSETTIQSVAEPGDVGPAQVPKQTAQDEDVTHSSSLAEGTALLSSITDKEKITNAGELTGRVEPEIAAAENRRASEELVAENALQKMPVVYRRTTRGMKSWRHSLSRI